MLVVPEGSPIGEVADLTGRRVGVVFGTEGHMEALGWEEVLVPPPAVVQHESTEAALESLTAGEVEAAVVDNLAAQTARNRGVPLTGLQPPLTSEPFVVVTRLEDETLTEAIDEHLDAMIADGTLEAIQERWMR
jgi:ABC-type amino acid transport substrate-binding protein